MFLGEAKYDLTKLKKAISDYMEKENTELIKYFEKNSEINTDHVMSDLSPKNQKD